MIASHGRASRRWGTQLTVRATGGIPAVAGVLAVAVALLTGLLLDMSFLLAGWADPFNVALIGVVYLAPVACGAAAAEGRAVAGAGLVGIVVTTTTGRRRALLLSWLSVAVWQVAAFAALSVVAAARVGTAGLPTPAMLLLPLSGGTVLLAVTAVGTLLGFLVPARATAPVAALSVFALLFGMSLVTGGALAFSVIYPANYYQPWLEPHAALVGGQVLLAFGLMLGAACGLARGRAARPLAVLAAFLVLGAGTSLLRTDPDPVQVRADPGSRACAQQDQVTLCVWPGSEDALAPGLESISRYVEAAAPFLAVPTEYGQPGLLPTSATTVLLPFGTRSVGDASTYTSLAVLSGYDCRRGPGAQAAGDLYTWLIARVDPTYADPQSPGYRTASRSPAEQQTWVDEQLASIRDCSG